MNRIISVGIAALLLLATLIFFTPVPSGGELGICLPSPNLWHLPHFGGWLLNAVCLAAAVFLLADTWKRQNLLSDNSGLFFGAFLILVTANSLSTVTLTTSTLLLAANAAAIPLLFASYESPNGAVAYFLIATLCAFGAMVQYAFLIMIPAYIAGGLLMKSFRLRELIAFVLGLVAPFWILIGFGLVSTADFHLPGRLTIFHTSDVQNDIFFSLLSTGIMALVGIILSLYNGVRLFSRNSRLRCMHSAVNLLGYLAVAAVIIDFTNFLAYFGIIALWCASQIAGLVSLYELRRPTVALLITGAIFVGIFIPAL